MSLGQCEDSFSPTDLAAVDSAVAAAERAGTTAFAASGDEGGLECLGVHQPDTRIPAQGISFPGDLPAVTSVGGTTLALTPAVQYLGETGWTEPLLSQGSTGGPSVLFPAPPWQRAPGATRIIAGLGIGGEYSAINSAIDEMMPARYRGRTDIWINGTYWLGAILGTFASFLLLNSMRPNEGWRVAFLLSGSMLAASAWLFDAGVLHAAAQTLIWIVVFFFASAGASARYLTVSEIFPIEIRAEALAVFFAIAQMVGAVGPAFYGVLIGNGASRTGMAIGYVVGGGIMVVGGLVGIVFGIDAGASRWSRSRPRSPWSTAEQAEAG